jgi:hypothetical protein
VTGPVLLPRWEQLEEAIPAVTGPMRRYLIQIGCVLRPGSVSGADLALRSFAAFVAETAPGGASLAGITRRHIEDFKPWAGHPPGTEQAAADPGYHRAPARHPADVLPAHRRMGLG